MGLHGLIVDWLFIFFLIFGEIVIVVNWKGPRARPPRTMGGFVPMIMDTAQPSEELLFKGRAQEWTFASSLNTPWRIGSWTGRFWCQPTPARDTRGSPEARSPKPFWEAMPGSKCGKHFACLQHQSGNRGDVETWGPFSSQASTRYNQITDDYRVAPNTTERSCPIRKHRAVPRSPCSKNQRDLFELRGQWLGQDGQGVLFDDFGFFISSPRNAGHSVSRWIEQRRKCRALSSRWMTFWSLRGWWILDAHCIVASK